MLLFSVRDVAQSFDGNLIFQKVNFEVQVGEKLALIGPNGIGKTSLLKIILGSDRPATGKVTFFKPVKRAWLNQDPDFPTGGAVGEQLAEAQLALNSTKTAGEALKKFGFSGREKQRVVDLSGGEKTRLQLAEIWLSEAELLLLDEPSNHLDIENREWLERFIREYPGTALVVSHDRYLLDRTVSRLLELGRDGVDSFPGNYSNYRLIKQEQFAAAEKAYFDRQKQLDKLETAVDVQKTWAGLAHRQADRKAVAKAGTKGAKPFYRAKAKKMDRRVKNTVKRLERMKEEELVRPKAARAIDLEFSAGKRANKGIFSAGGIAKAFGKNALFAAADLTLRHGEKVGLTGVNGSGKTTLLKIIAGLETVDSGQIWRSPTLRIGYLDQEIQSLTENRTVLEEVASGHADCGLVRKLLADLLIRGEAVFKPCAVLSRGERVRVAVAKLLLGPYDLLLCDEPANYLDLESREQLETALTAYGGSLVVVSHDRYLMERVVQTVWAIEAGTVRVYPGSYNEYRAKQLSDRTGQPKPSLIRLELELKQARLLGELAVSDRKRDEAAYLRLEAEFRETARRLREET